MKDIEVDLQYPEKLHEFHNNLPFLPERMKIQKVGKLVGNLHDKKRICRSLKKFKASIKSWISLKKVHRVI